MKTAYITTPIYYVNDVPHIGHWYSSIVADVITRGHILSGFDSRMQTGTDEHGQKIQKSAQEKGVLEMQFCNDISAVFRRMTMLANCGCSYEKFNLENFCDFDKTLENKDSNVLFDNGKNFIRTTEGRDLETGEITAKSIKSGRHITFVQEFWKTLERNGYIYKSKYSGWYAIRDEAFYGESELVKGFAPTGAEVEFREEECYFFRLSAFQKILLAILLDNKNLIKPHQKYTEVLSFLSGLNFEKASRGEWEEGFLKDICVSRPNLKWGIPAGEGQTVYVWLDALTNYLSALSESRDKFWDKRRDDAKVLHVVGKDILRFHAVYWPAFLIAEKLEYSELLSTLELDISEIPKKIDKKWLFDSVFAHGWWTNNGEKISKSLKNTIDPKDEIAFIENFGVKTSIATDYFRYFMVKAMPFGNDGSYSRATLLENVNADLANNIGNLVQRTLSMAIKYIPDGILEIHEEKCKNIQEKIDQCSQFYQDLMLDEALSVVLKIAREANEFIDEKAPWKLAKEGKISEISEALADVLVNISAIGICINPICPVIGLEILKSIGLTQAIKFEDFSKVLLEKKQFKIEKANPICPRLSEVLK